MNFFFVPRYCFTGSYLFIALGMNTAQCAKDYQYGADYKIERDEIHAISAISVCSLN